MDIASVLSTSNFTVSEKKRTEELLRLLDDNIYHSGEVVLYYDLVEDPNSKESSEKYTDSRFC